MGAEIEGMDAIMRKIKVLRESAGKRALQRGLSNGAKEAAKLVKRQVPSRYKDVRKAIGWRALKRSRNKGEPGAKVGAAVGRRRATTQRDRTGRRGVGISHRNIHWWFLGTKSRRTKNGRLTGRMPPQMRGIDEIVRQGKYGIAKAIRTHTLIGFRKEIAKLQK